jgi:hypothetical protein
VKKVLIVSPNFPPVNAPDMQRVRTSLAHFSAFGWKPFVLTVDSRHQSGMVEEPRLLNTIPADVPIVRTGALPLSVTGRIGVRNIGLRSFFHFYRAGARIVYREKIDLVYISTTMFATMALGRLWNLRFATPYVLDIQDPWVDDTNESARQLPKARWARLVNGMLEPFTMRKVSGLVAVSSAYHLELRRRYPWIADDHCVTVPFGAARSDFEEASKGAWTNRFFTTDGGVHGVYAGAVSPPMRTAARILFRAIKKAETRSPGAGDVRLTFVGTSYAGAGREQKAVESEAAAEGVSDRVAESPGRIPYFDTLRLLQTADFLVVLGSPEAEYVPSKIFQYILAGRPIVAVMNERSAATEVLRRSGAAVVTTFADQNDVDGPAERLSQQLTGLLGGRLESPNIDASFLDAFDARTLTQKQCQLFDSVLARETSPTVTESERTVVTGENAR